MLKAEITFEEQETKKNSAEGNGGKKSYYAKEKEPKLSTKVPTMKEAEQHILETLKNWGWYSKAIATTSMSAPSATSAFAMASIYRKLSTMPTPTSPTNIPTR